jgi:hypothetical protein
VGTVGDPVAAFQVTGDGGMRFEALELVKWRQVLLVVVEVDDEPKHYLGAVQVVYKAAPSGIATKRPTLRVLNQPGLVHGGVNGPQLLYSKAVLLRIPTGRQAVAGDHLLR